MLRRLDLEAPEWDSLSRHSLEFVVAQKKRLASTHHKYSVVAKCMFHLDRRSNATLVLPLTLESAQRAQTCIQILDRLIRLYVEYLIAEMAPHEKTKGIESVVEEKLLTSNPTMAWFRLINAYVDNLNGELALLKQNHPHGVVLASCPQDLWRLNELADLDEEYLATCCQTLHLSPRV